MWFLRVFLLMIYLLVNSPCWAALRADDHTRFHHLFLPMRSSLPYIYESN